MHVYTGVLVGGPDHGNSVSVAVTRIKVKTVTELWLNGEDNPSSFITETGSYYWNKTFMHFKWYTEGVNFTSNRMLQAA